MNYSQEIEQIEKKVEYINKYENDVYERKTEYLKAFHDLRIVAKKMQEELSAKDSAILKLREHIDKDWIPCSERLPQEDGVYLGSLIDNDIKVVGRVMGYWIDRVYGYENGVIAWMPLPEPFRGNI